MSNSTLVRPPSRVKRRSLARALFSLGSVWLLPVLGHAQAEPEPPALQTPAAPSLLPPRLVSAAAPAWPADVAPTESPVVVLIELTVDQAGLPQDPAVIESAGPAFDEAALGAVSGLRFEPATKDGVAILARIPFRFEFAPPLPPAPEMELPPAAVGPVEESPEPPAAEEPLLADGLTLEVRGEKPPRETTVHQLKSEEIRVIPGTNGDPLRAVETMPGVARPPGIDGQLVVRGSAPQDTAIFIDGISVPIAYHFGGLVSVIPSDALTRLDFRPGNFGPEFGRAMGGVIDIGLRGPRRDRFGGVFQLDVIDGRVMLEGPLGKRTRMMLAGRRSWVDTWIGHTTDSIKSAPVYYDSQAMIEHDFNSKTTGRVMFFSSDDRIAVFADPGASDPVGGRLSAHQGFTRLALRVDSQLTDKLRLAQTLSWGTERYTFKFAGENSNAWLGTWQSRTELRLRLNEWFSAVIGADVQVLQYETTMRIKPYPATDEVDGPYFARPSRLFKADGWVTRPAGYALLELMPTRNWRIVPGVRADYGTDTGFFTFDPRVTSRLDVHPGYPRTTLKGGAGLFHQPPQYQESVEPWGTAGVKSNRALHTSFGIEQEILPAFDVTLEGFYKQLTNLVVGFANEDEANSFGARFANTGRGRVYGGEFMLRYRPDDSRFFGWIAYTLSRSERANTKDEPFHTFQYDQTHILSALGSYKVGRGWTIGARFRYVTGAPYTPYVGGVLDLDAGAYSPIPSNTPYSARLPAFHQLDLRVDKTWQLQHAKLIAYLELRNAYNRQNAEAKTYSYDYANVSNQSGLPILPVIGLRGEL
ncbi:MAG: TonB family protein [Myxococcales bacterium]